MRKINSSTSPLRAAMRYVSPSVGANGDGEAGAILTGETGKVITKALYRGNARRERTARTQNPGEGRSSHVKALGESRRRCFGGKS